MSYHRLDHAQQKTNSELSIALWSYTIQEEQRDEQGHIVSQTVSLG